MFELKESAKMIKVRYLVINSSSFIQYDHSVAYIQYIGSLPIYFLLIYEVIKLNSNTVLGLFEVIRRPPEGTIKTP